MQNWLPEWLYQLHCCQQSRRAPTTIHPLSQCSILITNMVQFNPAPCTLGFCNVTSQLHLSRVYVYILESWLDLRFTLAKEMWQKGWCAFSERLCMFLLCLLGTLTLHENEYENEPKWACSGCEMMQSRAEFSPTPPSSSIQSQPTHRPMANTWQTQERSA